MNKYTFEFASVIEAENEDEAIKKFETEIIEEFDNTSTLDNITDSFTIRKL